MSKRGFSISLLLLAYIIVLGHSTIPHGHFDDLLSTGHQSESHSHQDKHHDGGHEHDYPFSHSVALHVVIDEQTTFTSLSVRNTIKKVHFGTILNNSEYHEPLRFITFSELIFHHYAHPPAAVYSSCLRNRPPPSASV